MTEPLTRENRYEGNYKITGTSGMFGFSMPETSIDTTRCRSCGSMVAIGSEDLHERLHPAPSCETVHPEAMIACAQPHAWEEQFR